jgi:hypothetical protein
VQPDFANNWKNEEAILRYLKDQEVVASARLKTETTSDGGVGVGGGVEGVLRTRTHTTVHYRQNRLVLFDSSLFHCTDKVRFRGGYKHSRINLTFLFGARQE